MVAAVAHVAPFAPNRRAVGWWLVALALLVAAMVVVGGLTRLTGSGLSITEWHPVTGAIPPLSAEAWSAEFAKYRHIPQYLYEHRGMSVAEFKTIYWWEWTHRLLGRFIGFAFLLPFLYFAFTRSIARSEWPRMVLLFALGGLQGFVGWWMVESGLETRVSVSQYRLAIHLGVAILLFGALLWTAFEYLWGTSRTLRVSTSPLRGGRNAQHFGWGAAPGPHPDRLAEERSALRPPRKGEVEKSCPVFQRVGGWLFLALVYVQMLLGALVAGLHAGLVYNTWPSMDGRVLPEHAFFAQPAWRNFFENAGLVQFDHRIGAYLIALGAGALWLATRSSGQAKSSANLLVAIVGVQIALGIATLVNQAPLVLAALHQITAVALFAAALWYAFELSRTPYAAESA
jgi:cytochrome c oxidase assembly protein subunit 15